MGTESDEARFGRRAGRRDAVRVALTTALCAALVFHWVRLGAVAQEVGQTWQNDCPLPYDCPVPIEASDDWQSLRSQIEQLQQSDAAKTRQIDELRLRIEHLGIAPAADSGDEQPERYREVSQPADQPERSPLDRALDELRGQQSPLDQAIEGLDGSRSPIVGAPVGGFGQLQLMDISLDILAVGGTSTQREESIQQLEGGDHDPHKRGFTLQGAELFLQGAVDPYFDAAAGVAFFIDPEGETIVELEEANFTTRSLPHGLQVKGGQYFTEFGRNNPTHPHAWHWIDQPIINSRVFGPDGMRGPGVRVSWLVPVQWYSEVYLGMQNANGETMASMLASEEFFEERPIGGRPFVARDVRSMQDLLYYARWENSWTDPCEEYTWLLGASVAFGPNATGLLGDTQIAGADLTMKWKPQNNERGWPFLIWENELIYRRYEADAFFDEGDPGDPGDDISLPPDDLDDWGFYTQALYGFKVNWAAGMRFEYVNGHGDSFNEDFQPISNDDDPFRDARYRISPLLTYYPTEFSRLRLQYNYDHARHLDSKDAHSFWLGAEVLIGSHPAHKF